MGRTSALADAVRDITINNAIGWSERNNPVGPAVCLVISFLLATRLLRWE